MTFTQFIQNKVGANYALRDILDNLEEETIEDEIDSFFRHKKDAILSLAKESRRFESGTDKDGFIYIQQLEEILNN